MLKAGSSIFAATKKGGSCVEVQTGYHSNPKRGNHDDQTTFATRDASAEFGRC